MTDKNEAREAVIDMKRKLLNSSLLDNWGLEDNSWYSKVYWLYQDVINFIDQHNQSKTESWLDQVKDRIEHPTSYGFDTIRVRDQLNMAITQMGHGLNIDWGKERIY